MVAEFSVQTVDSISASNAIKNGQVMEIFVEARDVLRWENLLRTPRGLEFFR